MTALNREHGATGVVVAGRVVGIPELDVIPPPGDAIYAARLAAGAEPLDFGSREDLVVARRRQAALDARGEHLTVDGLVGPASIAAARRHGFTRWQDVA